MKTVQQKLKPCSTCGHKTIHAKNGSAINWLLHIFLTIITAGFWIIPFLMIVFLGANIWDTEKWICTKCGTIN